MNVVVTFLLLAACIVNSEQTTCDAGFTCERCGDIDECQDNNGGCDADATCTNTIGSFSCECNAGYIGNGLTCSDVDECQTNNGGCDARATCTNTIGSFSCACNAGFNGNGFTCTDNDECQTNNGGCDADATCTNTVGSFSCACNAGFNGNGLTCAEDVRYIGCYADTADRDLNGFSQKDATTHVQMCINKCRSQGFRYAGLQATDWCFCGNTYGKHGTSTNCNLNCRGKASDNCGGYWANAVWTSGI